MDPFQAEEEIARAFAALQGNAAVTALAIADQLEATLPDDPRVHYLKASASLQCGTSDEAFAAARRAAHLAPENPAIWSLLGWATWNVGKLTAAQEAFELAITFSGRSPAALADYAWFMAVARGSVLAEKASLEAVRADVTSADAWAALGLAQYHLHRHQDARRSLGRALECDSDNGRAQWAMLHLLQGVGQQNQALGLARLMKDTPMSRQFVEEKQKEVTLTKALANEDLQRGILQHYWPQKRRWPRILAFVLIFGILLALPCGDMWRFLVVCLGVSAALRLWLTWG